MIILDLVAVSASWLADRFAPVSTERRWPDGEQPLVSDGVLAATVAAGPMEPMPSWYGGEQGFTDSSAGSAPSEGCVVSAVGPGPSQASPLSDGPGHLTWDEWDSATFAIRVYAKTLSNEKLCGYFNSVAEKLEPYKSSAAPLSSEAQTPASPVIAHTAAAESPAGPELRAHSPAGRPNIATALAISAAIGLREFADISGCETPTYWRNIADQLDPPK